MNNKGFINTLDNIRKIFRKIRSIYIFRLITKLISFMLTMVLILMITVGLILFYFNRKSNAYTEQGKSYTPPFGLYTIVSGSMEPNISVYDVVTTLDVQDISTIKVGDIVTFISTWDLNYGVTVTHRVIDIQKDSNGETLLVTKGDNNGSQDGAYVTKDNIIGKVIFRVPQLGRLQFFLATKMGWFIIVFVPALGVIIYDLLKILKLVFIKESIKNVEYADDAKGKISPYDRLDNRYLSDDALETTIVVPVNDVINNTRNVEPQERKEINREISKAQEEKKITTIFAKKMVLHKNEKVELNRVNESNQESEAREIVRRKKL